MIKITPKSLDKSMVFRADLKCDIKTEYNKYKLSQCISSMYFFFTNFCIIDNLFIKCR